MAIPTRINPNETTNETFTRWVSDGATFIGIFENQDLGSREVGRRFAMPFDASLDEKAVVGVTRAPDTKQHGLGWRYLLIEKTRNADIAECWMNGLEQGLTPRSGGAHA